MNTDIAEELICPITLNLLEDPITVPCCGRSYSRQSLIHCFDLNIRLCPICRKNLSNFNPRTVPKNIAISHIINIIKTNQHTNHYPENIETNQELPSFFANINNVIQNENNSKIIHNLINDSHNILRLKLKDRPIANAVTNLELNILKNFEKK